MAVDTRKNEVYSLNQPLLGVPNTPVLSKRAPTTTDKAQLGQMWINTATGVIYFLGRVSGATYTWFTGATTAASYASASFVTAATSMTAGTTIEAGTTITAGTGLTVTAGGANVTGNSIVTGTLQVTAGETIDAGGLTITAGGALITAGGLTVAAGSTVIAGTVNINTVGAGVTTIGNGGTGAVVIGNQASDTTIDGDDIVLTLSDDAGAKAVFFQDSTSTTVATIDSDGNIEAESLTSNAVTSDAYVVGTAGPRIIAGAGNPVGADVLGTLYIKTDAAGANDRLWIESDGAGTWVFFAASA